MSVYENAKAVTVKAGTAVTIHRFVALAADGLVDHVAGAQGDADGVAGETQATVGGTLPMAVLDGALLKVEAGAAVSVGDLIASDASGRAIVWVDSVGNKCLGRAHGAASGAGEIITIQGSPKKVGGGS